MEKILKGMNIRKKGKSQTGFFHFFKYKICERNFICEGVFDKQINIHTCFLWTWKIPPSPRGTSILRSNKTFWKNFVLISHTCIFIN